MWARLSWMLFAVMPYFFCLLPIVISLLGVALASQLAWQWAQATAQRAQDMACAVPLFGTFLPFCSPRLPLNQMVVTVGGGVQGLATSLQELPAPTILLDQRLQLQSIAGLVLHSTAIKDPHEAQGLRDDIMLAVQTIKGVTSGVNTLFFSTRAMVGNLDTYTRKLLRQLEWDQNATFPVAGGEVTISIDEFERYRLYCLAQIKRVVRKADELLLQFEQLDNQLFVISDHATRVKLAVQLKASGWDIFMDIIGYRAGAFSQAMHTMSWLNVTAHNGMRIVGMLKARLEGFQDSVANLHAAVDVGGEGGVPLEVQHTDMIRGLQALTEGNNMLRKPYYAELPAS
jgi:hypothetical protein